MATSKTTKKPRTSKRGSKKVTRKTTKLTTAQKSKVARIAKKGAKALGAEPISRRSIDSMVSSANKLKRSKDTVDIGDEAIALWAAKVDYAIANGDMLNVRKLIDPTKIGRPGELAFWDSNGGCSCGGGGTGPAGW